MRKFLKWFLFLVASVLLVCFFLNKYCHADRGVTIYSSYYSSAHISGVIGNYNENYDLEFGGYISGNNSSPRTGVTNYLMQGNLKVQLNDKTWFLYGLSAEIFTAGIVKGVSYTGTSYGPYVGIERRLDDNLRLRALYHPVYISSFDIGGVKTDITDFGLNGAFGLTYIF